MSETTIVPAAPGTTIIGFWDSDAPEPYAAQRLNTAERLRRARTARQEAAR